MGVLSLPELAKATGAPESFLSKVMQSLTHTGFISEPSRPGGRLSHFVSAAVQRQCAM